MGAAIVYFTGLLLAVVLILVLAYYEKQRGDNIDDLPIALCMAGFSWLTVLLFVLAYKDTYRTILKNHIKLFRK